MGLWSHPSPALHQRSTEVGKAMLAARDAGDAARLPKPAPRRRKRVPEWLPEVPARIGDGARIGKPRAGPWRASSILRRAPASPPASKGAGRPLTPNQDAGPLTAHLFRGPKTSPNTPHGSLRATALPEKHAATGRPSENRASNQDACRGQTTQPPPAPDSRFRRGHPPRWAPCTWFPY